MLPARMIDSDTYDLSDRSLVQRCADAFAADGVCVLPGFLRPEAVDRLVVECDALASSAHHSESWSTAYLTAPDPAAPAGHALATVERAAVAAVAYDLFPSDSALRALYEWDPLMDFVAGVLGEPVLHRYADPFGALNVAVMRDGDELGWHFDFTDFVVSIALQCPESGGHFENAARIRNAAAEDHELVADVMAGRRPDLVRTEPMTPGTLMVFNGRWSMHRVTCVRGATDRYVALLSYDRRPGADSSDRLKLTRYGRLPEVTS